VDLDHGLSVFSKVETTVWRISAADAGCTRIRQIPGIGPIVATAIVGWTYKGGLPCDDGSHHLCAVAQGVSRAYPDLRVEIEPYASGWDQEPREDVDVFFKLRAPRDSLRRIRPYPGTKRGLFASPDYISAFGNPASPEELTSHTCIGSGVWKLSRGSKLVAPNIVFTVVASDPIVHLKLAISGLGIAILPLYMAKRPDTRNQLVPVLPLWNPEPITLCALFSGSARLTPKVQVLLDFLGEYLGTDRDPRLQQMSAKGLFTDPKLEATSGP